MPIKSKDFHVVTYFKPADKSEDRRVLSHGEVGEYGSLSVESRTDDVHVDGYVENSDGRLSLTLNYNSYPLAAGKRIIPVDGGQVVVEARRVVDGKSKAVEPTKLSPLGVRFLEAQLAKEEARTEVKDRVRGELGEIERIRTRFTEEMAPEEIPASLKKLLPKTAQAFAAAVARWQAKVDGPIDARIAEAEKLLAGANVTDAQAERLEEKRYRLEQALEEHSAVLENLNEAIDLIIAQLPGDRLPTDGRRGAMIKALDTELAAFLGGSQVGNDLDDIGAAAARLQALQSPGFDIVGKVSVTPQIGKGGAVLNWTVRFENQGKQPFNGTVVFTDGEKNGGVGLESMACPHKGCSAEQVLIVGCDYGDVRALPGETVRLGVRSFGWTEVKLPKSGSISVDIGDFTVENDGQHRPEDWNAAHLEDKRDEKFNTGKVRFFVNDKPWWPR